MVRRLLQEGRAIPFMSRGGREGMSLPELAERCRIVIVSVPIAATAEVIRQVGPLLPDDSLLMDFTSLKEEPVREMLAATQAEVIGCHPLFGPDCPSLEGQNVILCPGRGNVWLAWLEAFFAKGRARITLTNPKEHDRMMSLVQGLTHLETLLMGLTLKDSGVDQWHSMPSPHPSSGRSRRSSRRFSQALPSTRGSSRETRRCPKSSKYTKVTLPDSRNWF